jgi:hypothetical protein
MSDPDVARLFPKDDCVAAVGELSAWTSVQTILAAARHIEGRPAPKDGLEPYLVIPFDDHAGAFESIISQAMEWLITGYRVPKPKIALARSLDGQISDETATALADRRFRPDIDRAPPGALSAVPAEKSALIIRDDPVVIEMIQAPLICMMDMLQRFNDTAKRMRLIQKKQEETTGGAPTIYHRPYADSRLSAVLEALCFYLWGLDFGPVWGEAGHSNIDLSYRAVNVHGVPPIDGRFLDVARRSMVQMLDSLR